MLVDDGLLRPRGRRLGRDGRPLDDRGPADDPALLTARLDRLDVRGARRDRAGLGRRAGLLVGRRRRALPGGVRAARAGQPAVADAQGAHPARRSRTADGGRVPVRAPPRPRRRLRGDAEGRPGRAARALRGLARGASRRPGRRVRGDRRLPPRAGLPQLLELGPANGPHRRSGAAGAEPLGSPAGGRYARGDMPAAVNCSRGRPRFLPGDATRDVPSSARARLRPPSRPATSTACRKSRPRRRRSRGRRRPRSRGARRDPAPVDQAAHRTRGLGGRAQREALRAIAAFQRLGDERGLARAGRSWRAGHT